MAQYATHPVHSSAALSASPTSSSTPSVPAAGANSQAQHKRVYQACIPCRRRKVRCDLGSVDNPHDPPCVRCRRESKECFFSATRRKRKTDDGADAGEDEVDEYIIRNGRKRLRASLTPPPVDHRIYNDLPLTPGGSQGRTQPLRRPGVSNGDDHTGSGRHGVTGDFGAGDEPNAQLENLEAQTVMRREVFGPHDALDLLYKAATDRFVEPTSANNPPADNLRRSPVPNHKRDIPPPPKTAMPPRSTTNTSAVRRMSRSDRAKDPGQVKLEQPIDPELTKRDLTNEPGYADAIKAWGRFRFVRAGWFTPQEAIEYID
jgi:hypothetical protein